MGEKILVTGATGILGSEVVKQLSKDASDINIRASIHSFENIGKYDIQELRQYKLTTISKF